MLVVKVIVFADQEVCRHYQLSSPTISLTNKHGLPAAAGCVATGVCYHACAERMCEGIIDTHGGGHVGHHQHTHGGGHVGHHQHTHGGGHVGHHQHTHGGGHVGHHQHTQGMAV